MNAAHERAAQAIRAFPFWDYDGMEGTDPFTHSTWVPDLAGAVLDAAFPDLRAWAARLRAAEKVCVLYGMSPHRDHTDREKACMQAWAEWTVHAPEPVPLVTDAEIARLAAARGQAAANTIARLQSRDNDLQ